MFNLDTLMVLIPALPLAACIFTAIFGKHLLGPRGTSADGAGHDRLVPVAACRCLFEVQQQAAEHGSSLAAATRRRRSHEAERARGPLGRLGTHGQSVALAARRQRSGDAAGGGRAGHVAGQPVKLSPARLPFDIDVTLRVDPLTSIMLSMVTFIASLVAIYAIGYMHGDPGYWRFFTYIGLFVFSMTMLVSVSNFVLLYVFWEAVGMCSYLLVGFWYEKPEAAAAGKKAFLVNRVGDFGFALGLFLIYVTYGTLNFHDVPADWPACWARRGSARPSLYVGGGSGHGDWPAVAGREPAARVPSFRCTSGCPTPWKAPRRSAP